MQTGCVRECHCSPRRQNLDKMTATKQLSSKHNALQYSMTSSSHIIPSFFHIASHSPNASPLVPVVSGPVTCSGSSNEALQNPSVVFCLDTKVEAIPCQSADTSSPRKNQTTINCNNKFSTAKHRSAACFSRHKARTDFEIRFVGCSQLCVSWLLH